MESEHYNFVYESSGRFILLLLPVIPVYFLLTFVAAPVLETKFTSNEVLVWHSLTCILMGVGVFILMRTVLRRLYIFQGTCSVYEDRLEFKLKDRCCIMPFTGLKEICYQSGGRRGNDWLVLSAKKKGSAKTIRIEAAPLDDDKYQDIISLWQLCNILQSRHYYYERFGKSKG